MLLLIAVLFAVAFADPAGNPGVFSQFMEMQEYHLGREKTKNLIGFCANFEKVWTAYPDAAASWPTDALKAVLGGQVGADWVPNTCTIRMTISLRALGLDPGNSGHSVFNDQYKNYYLIRVKNMKPYMDATFGKPFVTNTVAKSLVGPGMDKHVGVIRYSDCHFGDATGHFDVWDGAGLKDHGYTNKKCNKVEIWNVCNIKSNPDYSKLLNRKKAEGRSIRTRDMAGFNKKLRDSRKGRSRAVHHEVKDFLPTREQVITVQKFLKAMKSVTRDSKYSPGNYDGEQDQKTLEAIKHFRANHEHSGERASTFISEKTWELMIRLSTGNMKDNIKSYIRCPYKEPFWKDAKCFATTASGEKEVMSECCRCPNDWALHYRPLTEQSSKASCYFHQKLFLQKVVVNSKQCCKRRRAAEYLSEVAFNSMDIRCPAAKDLHWRPLKKRSQHKYCYFHRDDQYKAKSVVEDFCCQKHNIERMDKYMSSRAYRKFLKARQN